MRKVPVYGLDGKKVKDLELPEQFNQPVRNDLIRRAFLAIMSHKRQKYGADPLAGKRTSADYRGRRYAYGSWANRGLSRLPRIRVGSGHMVGTVRFVPHAVKGRRAHPPKAEKEWAQKINKKERRLAILSAISATRYLELVKGRGHRVDVENLPIVVVSDLENIGKTKEVRELLTKLGLEKEMERVSEKRQRAGKGKMRGRRYKKRKGPLIVVSKKCPLIKAVGSIPGVDVITVDSLNVELLAPGSMPGRLTIWSEEAIKKLKENNLFAVN